MHLDTHVVAWLHEGDPHGMPKSALRRLDAEPLEISPVVQLELAYLREVGKLSVPMEVLIGDLRSTLGLTVLATPFHSVVSAAVGLTWARDPFDRLIAAQALAENAPLLTADRMIRKHLPLAIWDDADL